MTPLTCTVNHFTATDWTIRTPGELSRSNDTTSGELWANRILCIIFMMFHHSSVYIYIYIYIHAYIAYIHQLAPLNVSSDVVLALIMMTMTHLYKINLALSQ